MPGLSEPGYLAGAHIERMYPFAPTAGAARCAGLQNGVFENCLSGTFRPSLEATYKKFCLSLLIVLAIAGLLRLAL